MSRQTIATLDLAALAHNFQIVKQQAAGAKILAMVKASGYGHGAAAIAKGLPEADAFGVAFIDEAVALRQAGVTSPIVIMQGVMRQAEWQLVIEHDFQVVVHQAQQVVQLTALGSLVSPITVWLKFDTGMHRLGFSPEQVPALWQRLQASPAVADPIILMGHFSEADVPGSTVTLKQFTVFEKVTQGYPALRSLANSAGLLGSHDCAFDWVRPGLMLYGASPIVDRSAASLNLQPVMTLTSELIAIDWRAKGECIAYNGREICPRDTRIGMVTFGYADGLPYRVSPGTQVRVGQRLVSLLGQLSMDMLTVDLGPDSRDQIGDLVEIWGPANPVERLAASSNVSTYQLFTQLHPRVPRVVRTLSMPVSSRQAAIQEETPVV